MSESLSPRFLAVARPPAEREAGRTGGKDRTWTLLTERAKRSVGAWGRVEAARGSVCGKAVAHRSWCGQGASLRNNTAGNIFAY